MKGEIFVVTGHGHGHLHPCMQLCQHLTRRHFQTTLVLSSSSSSSATAAAVSLVSISPPPPPMPGSDFLSSQSAQDLHHHLLTRFKAPPLPHPVCAIIDFQMGWTKHLFWKFDIPVISLFTFGACAASMEWGAWKVNAGDLLPGQTRLIPGLPQEMEITHMDLKRKSSSRKGPPRPGDRPPWVFQIEGSVGLMFNTCDDLESVFIKYMEDQVGLPAWGVGPLLPDKYWQPSDEITKQDKRDSDLTEEEVLTWLDSKEAGTVIYVAFGSEVGPTVEEYQELSDGLEDSTRPFIWVVQAEKGYFPNGLDKRVGERGLIIHGWAPQLLILSHGSIGGFLSHCGWNSTMEAIGVGVPILAWPIRGDQYFNAKLVVDYLKLGYKVAEDFSKMVCKDEILKGIEKLMKDEEMRSKAIKMKGKLKDNGFPATSEAALDAFWEFLNKK